MGREGFLIRLTARPIMRALCVFRVQYTLVKERLCDPSSRKPESDELLEHATSFSQSAGFADAMKPRKRISGICGAPRHLLRSFVRTSCETNFATESLRNCVSRRSKLRENETRIQYGEERERGGRKEEKREKRFSFDIPLLEYYTRRINVLLM